MKEEVVGNQNIVENFQHRGWGLGAGILKSGRKSAGFGGDGIAGGLWERLEVTGSGGSR